jgi:hypothetical protein
MGIQTLADKVSLAEEAVHQVCESIVQKRGFPNEVFTRLVVFFVSKSATSFFAVEKLWRDGLGADAQVLVRTILENAVNLYYIHQSPQDRAERFLGYEHMEAYKELMALKCTGQTSGISPQVEAEIVANYSTYRDVYKGRATWSGRNLEEMARACDLGKHYDIVYRYTSGFAHGSPKSTLSYISLSGDTLTFNVAVPDQPLADRAMIGASILTLMVLELACGVFGIPLPTDFIAARDSFLTTV